jgi:hypothetical protein
MLRSRQSLDQCLWLLLSATTCVLAVLLYRSNTPLVPAPPEEVTNTRSITYADLNWWHLNS